MILIIFIISIQIPTDVLGDTSNALNFVREYSEKYNTDEIEIDKLSKTIPDKELLNRVGISNVSATITKDNVNRTIYINLCESILIRIPISIGILAGIQLVLSIFLLFLMVRNE